MSVNHLSSFYWLNSTHSTQSTNHMVLSKSIFRWLKLLLSVTSLAGSSIPLAGSGPSSRTSCSERKWESPSYYWFRFASAEISQVYAGNVRSQEVQFRKGQALWRWRLRWVSCVCFLGLILWTFPFSSVPGGKLLARGKDGDKNSSTEASSQPQP